MTAAALVAALLLAIAFVQVAANGTVGEDRTIAEDGHRGARELIVRPIGATVLTVIPDC